MSCSTMPISGCNGPAIEELRLALDALARLAESAQQLRGRGFPVRPVDHQTLRPVGAMAQDQDHGVVEIGIVEFGFGHQQLTRRKPAATGLSAA